MYVKTILDEKGRNVVTGGPQLTVRQAAVYLHENHIGAIVIVDRNDRIAGIATERDIVAAVARNGAECLDKPISSIMWGNVHRCGENQTVDELMEMMSKRMLADVPKADVVVTNPTHIAVALSYNTSEAPAPIVLAKGADHLAEKIKEIARENRIPIRENVPLARALYKSTEVGDMIPEELYKAVASVLASIWKLKPKAGKP